MQPEKLAEVRSWLKKAASDLRGATSTWLHPRRLLKICCFIASRPLRKP